MTLLTQMRCMMGVYLFYAAVNPAAARDIPRWRTAINSANTVEQPCERLDRFGRGGALTPGFPSGPAVFYLRDGQNPKPQSKNTRAPDLITKGQEVVIYPHTVQAGYIQLRGVTRGSAFAPPPHTRDPRSYLGGGSGKTIRTGGARGEKKNTHKVFPASIKAAKSAASISVGQASQVLARIGKFDSTAVGEGILAAERRVKRRGGKERRGEGIYIKWPRGDASDDGSEWFPESRSCTHPRRCQSSFFSLVQL